MKFLILLLAFLALAQAIQIDSRTLSMKKGKGKPAFKGDPKAKSTGNMTGDMGPPKRPNRADWIQLMDALRAAAQ